MDNSNAVPDDEYDRSAKRLCQAASFTTDVLGDDGGGDGIQEMSHETRAVHHYMMGSMGQAKGAQELSHTGGSNAETQALMSKMNESAKTGKPTATATGHYL